MSDGVWLAAALWHVCIYFIFISLLSTCYDRTKISEMLNTEKVNSCQVPPGFLCPSRWWEFFAWSLRWEKSRRSLRFVRLFHIHFSADLCVGFVSPTAFSTQSHEEYSIRQKNFRKKLGFKFLFLWMIKCDDWTVDSWKCSDFSELLSWTTHRWPKRKRKNREKKEPKNKHFFPFFHSGRRRSDTTLAMPANVECLSVERKWREIKNLECKFFYGFYNKLRLLPSSLALALAIRVELQQSLIFSLLCSTSKVLFSISEKIYMLFSTSSPLARVLYCPENVLSVVNVVEPKWRKKHNRHTEKKDDEPSSKLDDRVNRSCTSRAAAIVTAAAVFPPTINLSLIADFRVDVDHHQRTPQKCWKILKIFPLSAALTTEPSGNVAQKK